MRRTHLLVGIVFGLLPVVGCSGPTDRRWSEEVQLDDGRVIVIDRYVKFQSSNSLARDAYSSTELKSTLTFTQEFSATPAWDGLLIPILLYRDEAAKEWVIVATSSNCDTWYQQGKPVPPYWEFRLHEGKWTKTKLSKSSVGRKTNLFFNYEKPLPTEKLSVALKDRVLASENFPQRWRLVSDDATTNCD